MSSDADSHDQNAAGRTETQRRWWGGEVDPLEINRQILRKEAESETARVLMRACLAEFIAMFIFVYISCGAASSTVNFKTVGNTQIAIALAFGFAIVALAFTFGHISGAHINLAVTFSFWVQRKITFKRFFWYAVAQFLGACFGGLFMRATFPGAWNDSCFGANTLATGVSPGSAFFVEMILTGYLLLVVNSATDPSKSNTTLVPLAIGLAVFGAHMVAVPLTGTSINPTRSFASALASTDVPECMAGTGINVWSNHWIFWVAPLLGGAIGGLIYEYGFNAEAGHQLSSAYTKDKDQE